ncbi:MAG: sigma-70 family RNA polymerase sigma factor [Clostridia bacterium]|nr:sigma-70 family RNA polymerase sigma factor [Clostridia bacterium]
MTQAERRTSLTRMMTEHGDAIFRMCCLHLKDIHLAEDATQEAFLKAYRRMDTFRGECAEATWLTGIAINVCRDFLRTAWLRRVDRSADISLLPECAQADEYQDPTVLNEVMRLPAKLREVILLRFYQGLTIQEAADALHIGASAVKSRQRRAGELLRQRLKEWYDEE